MRTPVIFTWVLDGLRRVMTPQAAGYASVPAGDETLPEPVFRAELEAVRARRREFGLPDPQDGKPSVRQDLMGLAISGGGIRSATFNLGLVQALARFGLLSRVDYLSTVSGGGYLGSAISSLCATAPAPEDVMIILSGVPAGVRLSAGVQTVDGCWRLGRGDLDGLRLLVPAGVSCAMTLVARAEPDQSGAAMAEADCAGCARLRVVMRPAADLPAGLGVAVHRHAQGQGLRFSGAAEGTPNGYDLPLHIHTEAFPFTHQPGVSEGEAFRHLRDSSNYLVPREFLAGLRLPALFLRGLLINLLILLPLVVVAALVTLWVSSGSLREAMDVEEAVVTLDGSSSPWVTELRPGHYVLHLRDGIAARAVGDSGPMADQVAVVNIPRGVEVAGRTARDHNGIVAAVRDLPRIEAHVSQGAPQPARITLRFWRESGDSLTPASLDPITALHERALHWVRGGVVAFLGLLALYPLLEWLLRQRGRPDWRTRDIATRYGAGGALLAILVSTALLVQPLAIYYYHSLSQMQLFSFGDAGEVTTLASLALTAFGVLFSGSFAERTAGVRGRVALHMLGLMGPFLVWLFYLNISRWALVPETAPDWLLAAGDAFHIARYSPAGGLLGFVGASMDGFGQWLGDLFRWADDGSEWLPHSERMTIVYGAVAVTITLVTQFFYDVNSSSFHGFYRDRLSRAYLFDIWRGRGKPRQNDDQRLSALDVRRAPYHLVNTTLNVQHSKTANMRGRNGSNVIMSRAYVGGQLTGYRATRDMEMLHPALDLGTAMAISGAAAAPNMGRNTVRGLTFVLTLLNVRLGYWLPHPRAYSGRWFARPLIGPLSRMLLRPFRRVTPVHLLKEMAGSLTESGLHVNLTDGGHLENMGLIELLRRRCRVIIIGDAEADPGMSFQGFADAVRMARMDLGVTIEIDVDPLRPEAGPEGRLSRAHAAIGRINYGDGEIGYLLYFKSSLTGDENVYVEKYLAQDPTFPHQTTADQFFDEEQFEAYRALGYHVAESVIGRHLAVDPFARDLDGLADRMGKLTKVALI